MALKNRNKRLDQKLAPHLIGKGFTLALNAIPVNGRIVMRINEEKPANKKGS